MFNAANHKGVVWWHYVVLTAVIIDSFGASYNPYFAPMFTIHTATPKARINNGKPKFVVFNNGVIRIHVSPTPRYCYRNGGTYSPV